MPVPSRRRPAPRWEGAAVRATSARVSGPAFADDPFVDGQVVGDHPVRAEALLGLRPAGCPVDRAYGAHGGDGLVDAAYEEPGDALVDDLGHGAALVGDDR